MTPDQLHELGELASDTPRFEARLLELAAAAGQRQIVGQRPSYSARRSLVVSDIQQGDAMLMLDMVSLLQEAGAGAPLEAILADSQTPEWLKVRHPCPALESPADQALACLRVLHVSDYRRSSKGAWDQDLYQPWIESMAQRRLDELLLTFPALAHPAIRFPIERNSTGGNSLLIALAKSFSLHEVTLPISGEFARSAPAELVQAWANHPAVSAALHDTTRSRNGEEFLYLLNDRGMGAPLLASIMELDRLRYARLSQEQKDAAASQPPGKYQVLSGIQPVQSDAMRDVVYASLVDTLVAQFESSWQFPADNFINRAAAAEAGEPEAAPFTLGAIPTLLREMSLSPTFDSHEQRHHFLETATLLAVNVSGDAIVLPAPDSAGRTVTWETIVCFEHVVASLCAAGCYAGSEAAAAEVAEVVLRPGNPDDLAQLERADADAFTHESVLALLETLSRYGVTPARALELLQANGDATLPNLTAAAQALATKTSMEAALAGTRAVQGVSAKRRAPL